MKEINIDNIIKSKLRVQKHGEVFTPHWMVEKMLTNEKIRNACENIHSTFLEPSAGEGNFLILILRRKLNFVIDKYSNTLTQFENFSLYALSTLYGIELLEDNAQMCAMNLYEVYNEIYFEVSKTFNKQPKKNVLDSAKVIIKANIAQGNFLTRQTADNKPIVFSEWKITSGVTDKTKIIKVARTDYSLNEIYENKKNDNGDLSISRIKERQLTLFDIDTTLNNHEELKEEKLRYSLVKITDVYKEEVEYIEV